MLCRRVELVNGLDVVQLMGVANGVEVREWIPDTGGLCVLLDVRACQGVAVRAVGLVPVGDVVAPRDLVLVEQLREIRPRIDRLWPLGSRRRTGRVLRRLRGLLA